MELGHVSIASIMGMAVTLIISVVLPIVLLIIAKVKYHASVKSFWIGAGIFTLFALILEQILHSVVILAVGQDNLTANIWLYALYGAGAAAVFEETGRFLAFKFLMKNRRNRENAFMYGIGHGGIEAIMVVGMTSISNIVTSYMINVGAMSTTLNLLDANMRQITYEQISQLWTLPAYMFYLGGIERVIAIFLHIAMTFVMYRGVKFGEKKYIAMAFVIHFVADFATVVINNMLPTYVVEIILLIITVGAGYFAYVINRGENEDSYK